MRSKVLHRPSVSILSPLRYPGAKRRLASYIARSIALNGVRPELYVEPFAGGASIALQLLADDQVDSVGLVDLDPLVAAFWKTVFAEPDWLCERIEKIDVTLATWRRYKRKDPATCRLRALACLFLNRTSFSGILAPSAGPLGGWKQESEYSLACRFPRETLIQRIQQAAALAKRVAFVWNVSWARALSLLGESPAYRQRPKFFYFDPPFFQKASRLYRHYFEERQHLHLRDALLQLKDPWILSYDSAARVEELYADAPQEPTQLELLYSTSRNGGISIAREVIVTNLQHLPTEERLWRRSHEWKRTRSRKCRPCVTDTRMRHSTPKIA